MCHFFIHISDKMQKNNFKFKIIVNRVFVWLFVWAFFYVGQIKMSLNYAFWDSFMVVVSLLIIFYSNTFWRKNDKSRINRYRVKSIFLVLLISATDVFLEQITQSKLHFGVSGNTEDWYTLFSITLFLVFNTCAFLASELFALQQESHRNEILIGKLREEHMASQLDLLRSRIDPHFLFNSLNTIYTLSYLNDERTSEKIMQLSEMLRYVLYDCNTPMVPVINEINYLNSYIEINQLRSKSLQNVVLDVVNSNDNAMIAPMILLPFVENAFKHSQISREKEGYIKIFINVKRNQLHFLVENSLPAVRKQNEAFTSSGIGLENVKKRLDLQYGDKCQLKITPHKEYYRVQLTFDLS